MSPTLNTELNVTVIQNEKWEALSQSTKGLKRSL